MNYQSGLRDNYFRGSAGYTGRCIASRMAKWPMPCWEAPTIEDMADDKISTLRDIFERLFNKKHPVRKNLFFRNSLKSIRIIEGQA